MYFQLRKGHEGVDWLIFVQALKFDQISPSNFPPERKKCQSGRATDEEVVNCFDQFVYRF